MGFNLQQACQMLIVSPHVHLTLKVIPTSQCENMFQRDHGVLFHRRDAVEARVRALVLVMVSFFRPLASVC